MDRRTVLAGDTLPRGFSLVAKASGNPLVSGTVNHYVKALTGANAGKWWRDSDQTWQVAETANAMTHQADGHWTRALAASPWTAGVLYLEYAKESGDLHIPTGWLLVASYTPSADSSRRVDTGLIEGGDATAALELAAAIGAAAALTAYDAPNQTDLDAAEAAILAGVAAVEADTADLQTRLPAALDGGRIPAVLAATPPTAAAIATAVDAQLSGTHGGGAWGSGASGEYTRTIHVQDADTGAPLRDALVTVRDETDTGLVDQKRTSAAGNAVMSLDADTYALTVRALGYSALSADELVIPAANGTTTVELTALAVSPPSSDEFVTLYGDLFLDAEAQEAATVTAEIADEDLPAVIGAYGLNSGAVRTGTAGADGRWELELQRGIRYRITAEGYGLLQHPLTMPTDVDDVTLVSLLE